MPLDKQHVARSIPEAPRYCVVDDPEAFEGAKAFVWRSWFGSSTASRATRTGVASRSSLGRSERRATAWCSCRELRTGFFWPVFEASGCRGAQCNCFVSSVELRSWC